MNPIYWIYRFVMWALPIRHWAKRFDDRSGSTILTREFTFHEKPLTIPLALLPFAVMAAFVLFVFAFGKNIDHEWAEWAKPKFWIAIATIVLLIIWQIDAWRRGRTP